MVKIKMLFAIGFRKLSHVANEKTKIQGNKNDLSKTIIFLCSKGRTSTAFC